MTTVPTFKKLEEFDAIDKIEHFDYKKHNEDKILIQTRDEKIVVQIRGKTSETKKIIHNDRKIKDVKIGETVLMIQDEEKFTSIEIEEIIKGNEENRIKYYNSKRKLNIPDTARANMYKTDNKIIIVLQQSNNNHKILDENLLISYNIKNESLERIEKILNNEQLMVFVTTNEEDRYTQVIMKNKKIEFIKIREKKKEAETYFINGAIVIVADKSISTLELSNESEPIMHVMMTSDIDNPERIQIDENHCVCLHKNNQTKAYDTLTVFQIIQAKVNKQTK